MPETAAGREHVPSYSGKITPTHLTLEEFIHRFILCVGLVSIWPSCSVLYIHIAGFKYKMIAFTTPIWPSRVLYEQLIRFV